MVPGRRLPDERCVDDARNAKCIVESEPGVLQGHSGAVSYAEVTTAVPPHHGLAALDDCFTSSRPDDVKGRWTDIDPPGTPDHIDIVSNCCPSNLLQRGELPKDRLLSTGVVDYIRVGCEGSLCLASKHEILLFTAA
jgi:hypothetical protein